MKGIGQEGMKKMCWKQPGLTLGCRAISRRRSRNSNINLIEKLQNVVKFMENVSHTDDRMEICTV